MTSHSAHNHVRIVSLLTLVAGIIFVFPALLVLLVAFGLVGGGFLSDTPLAMFTAGGILGIIAVCIALIALPTVIAGFGLLARKSWARPLTLIIAAFKLFVFPIGTALALYQFWVLAVNDETVAAYKGESLSAGVRDYA